MTFTKYKFEEWPWTSGRYRMVREITDHGVTTFKTIRENLSKTKMEALRSRYGTRKKKKRSK